MKRLQILTVILLVLLILPACVNASQTAPLNLDNTNVESTKENGRVLPFRAQRSFNGVSASDQWLKQVRLDGISLNLRLFARDGEGVMIQEKLNQASDGKNLRLIIRQENEDGGLLLQADQTALETLRRLLVAEITVVDYNYYIQNTYTVDTLLTIREMLSLKDTEQLCVAGMEDPLSVVSENGIRRVITE